MTYCVLYIFCLRNIAKKLKMWNGAQSFIADVHRSSAHKMPIKDDFNINIKFSFLIALKTIYTKYFR